MSNLGVFLGPPDVQGKRMTRLLMMKSSVIPFASTTTVEAVQADIQTQWVILGREY